MLMKYKRYSQDFKKSALELVKRSNKKIKDLAKDLDINPKTLYNWIYDDKKKISVSKDARLLPQNLNNDEIVKLRKENNLLKRERDILKEATAYFAQDLLETIDK